MERYQNNIQDQFGNAISGVTVTVRRVSDGAIAAIFSDNGVTPKSNPFTNDLDGELFFYAANSRYDIFFTGPITDQKDDVLLLDISSSGTSISVLTDIVTATPPTTELVTGVFTIRDADDTDLLAAWGFGGSNTLFLKNYMEAGVVQIRGEQAGGGDVTLFEGDPDGAFSAYWRQALDPSLKLSTIDDGIQVHSVGNADNQARKVNFCHVDGTNRGDIGHISGSSIFGFHNDINAGGFSATARDGGGGSRQVFFGGGGAPMDWYAPTDIKRWSMETGGQVRLYGDTGSDGEVRQIAFSLQFTDTDRALVGHEADDEFYIRNMIHGAGVTITAEDAGGSVRTILDADPDAATILNADTDLELHRNVGERVFWAIGGGNLNIYAKLNELAIVAVPDAAVTLYYDNIEGLRTRSNATGHTTMGQVKHADGNFYDVGLGKLPINTISAAEDIDNNNQQFYTRKSSGGAVTLELQNTSNIQTGVAWQIANVDTENVTIDATTNTCTLNFLDGSGGAPPTGNRTLAQAGVCTIIKIGVAEYDIFGNAGLS